MGTITSGIGLISGLDFSSIVDQLIAIEARPRNQLLRRIGALDAQRTALLDISARILGMQSRVSSLTDSAFFRAVTSTSSNPSVLTVSAGINAQIGSYNFTVRNLASAHQMVSTGLRSRNSVLPRGSFMIESAAARVNNATTLDELNGYDGVQRGKFKIIDGDGEDAVIDLRELHTLGDVVNAVNDAGIAVSARIERDAIVLSDSTGNSFRVRELDGGHTAADLGFSGESSSGTNEITGEDLIYLSGRTPLSELNDGNGLRRAQAGGDFSITTGPGVEFDVDLSGILTKDTRIQRLNNAQGVEMGVIQVTNRLGQETEIDLSGLTTIEEVLDAINDSGAGVLVTNVSSRLILSDQTVGEGVLTIEDLNGGSTAAGLGIAGTTEGDKITGRDILRIETLADVIAAVNFASGNEAGTVVADFDEDGKRLRITGESGRTGRRLIIETIGDSRALEDLGIVPGGYGERGEPGVAIGRRVIGGLDTVLLSTLNGGQGFQVTDGELGATIRITDATGAEADVDLSNAETLQDVIDAIREQNLAIDVGYDPTRTRLLISNADGQTGSISISDVSLNFAQAIGIAQTGETIKSDNLQRQYVSESTLLKDLNGGLGVSRGSFKITDSRGFSATVDLNRSEISTLGDVIREINRALPSRIEARINDTGDGLIIEDLSDPRGAFDLKIEEAGGTAARDLNILGETDEGFIDGSYEINVDLNGAETLDDAVTLINEQSRLVRADVFNDGGQFNPFRLSITSRATGTPGELIVDGSLIGFEFDTLSEAADAVVVVGGEGGGGLVVRSHSNTIEDIVPGLTLNLIGTDEEPVDVTVAADHDRLISTLSGIVSDYNALLDRMDELTQFDPESERRGILLGDGTTLSINNRLSRLFTRSVPGATGLFNRLSQIGMRIGSGARLEFDEQKFRGAIENNPDDVAQFFTDDEVGIAHAIKETLEGITGAEGLIKKRESALDRQKEVFSARVETLNDLLERRRARLTADFLRMERALAGLQFQQASLLSLQALVSS